MLRAVLCTLVLGGTFAGVANAVDIPGWDPNWTNANVVNIEVSNLQGAFTAGGGADGLGVLTISPKGGGPSITLHWDTGQDWSLTGSSAIIEAIGNLYQDNSGVPPLAAGQACGWFDGDGVGLADPSLDWRLGWDLGLVEVNVLAGVLDIYRAQEIMTTNLLEGSGLVTATSGSLVSLGLWPTEQSSISSFTFMIDRNIDDFSEDFTGDMFMTFWPDDEHGVPEPTTLALLGGGIALAALRRRR